MLQCGDGVSPALSSVDVGASVTPFRMNSVDEGENVSSLIFETLGGKVIHVVGCSDGSVVGVCEGCELGNSVGAILGKSVGLSLGD